MSATVEHSSAPFRSSLGVFILHAFEIEGLEHAALVHGHPDADPQPLVRIQSACVTGNTFLAELCDCRQQLQKALGLIAAEHTGVVLYLDQEGRSHGLVEKVAQLNLIAEGASTAQAARARAKEVDLRTYEPATAILRLLACDRPIRLLTNNPAKLQRVEAAGIIIAERLSIEVEPTQGNREYLRIKKEEMGHLLERV